MARRKEYKGTEITVTFDLARCIHARNCFLKLPDVFDPSARPWVRPDNAPAEEIASMVRTCPSGALQFSYTDGKVEKPPKINRITVLENGPLAVSGEVRIDGEAQETRATLCRCGLSKNKPYCDYSHVEGAFQATGEPTPKDSFDETPNGGVLNITRTPNGPLEVQGHMEITTGTGHKIGRQSKAYLCRCGASKNKPYCDGSHKAIGFTDPVGEET